MSATSDAAATTSSAAAARAPLWQPILWAGLVAGALDILYVIVYYAVAFTGVGAAQILKSIAAGLLGRDAARAGGNGIVLLGLGLHFVIAFGAAAVFCVAARRFRVLVAQPWISGPLYGVAVWLTMNLVVLPLSANPPKTFPSNQWVAVLIAHLVCVGLPIALIARRFSR